jgi:hypothetical protein
MQVYMHCIHQDAIVQKALAKQQKADDAAAARKATTAKKNAKTVVDTLSAPLLLFEEETRKMEAVGPSYLLESAKMLLARVKDMVVSATHRMIADAVHENPEDGIEWDMEEVKLAKIEMMTKMRNL